MFICYFKSTNIKSVHAKKESQRWGISLRENIKTKERKEKNTNIFRDET